MKILFIIIFFFIFNISFAMTCEQCKLIQRQVDLEISRNALYKIGAQNKKVGTPADCSGFVARIIQNMNEDAITRKLRVAGIPIRRSQTTRMLQNLDGWKGQWKTFEDSKKCMLPFMDFGSKIYKHVGIFRGDVTNNRALFAHASGSYGIIESIMEKNYKNPYYTHFLKSLDLE